MWLRFLIPTIAILVGLTIGHQIEQYANSLRPAQVMSMVETFDDGLIEVPQPKPYINVVETKTNYYHYQSCTYRQTWWERGPVRRLVKRIHERRPVRRLLARILGRRCW